MIDVSRCDAKKNRQPVEKIDVGGVRADQVEPIIGSAIDGSQCVEADAADEACNSGNDQ